MNRESVGLQPVRSVNLFLGPVGVIRYIAVRLFLYFGDIWRRLTPHASRLTPHYLRKAGQPASRAAI